MLAASLFDQFDTQTWMVVIGICAFFWKMREGQQAVNSKSILAETEAARIEHIKESNALAAVLQSISESQKVTVATLERVNQGITDKLAPLQSATVSTLERILEELKSVKSQARRT